MDEDSIKISPVRDNSKVAEMTEKIELIQNNVPVEPYETEYTSSDGGRYLDTMFDQDGADVKEHPVEDIDITDLIIETLEVQIKWLKYLKQKQ